MKSSLLQPFNKKIDIREDEEQTIKLNEIVHLLVAAGYFRARIKGLSDFDKVVGGITWCIESCNFDVNINFLFHENLTIGQKIALTEKIVIILPTMNCPHSIEPHQIQGLDCIHIFPVIQWLLKRTIEARKEIVGCVRFFIGYRFDKTHAISDQYFGMEEHKKYPVHLIKRIYEPRPQSNNDLLSTHQVKKLKYTLFEYGLFTVIKSDVNSSNNCNQENVQIKTEVFLVESSFQLPYIHENHFNVNILGKILSLRMHEVAENSKLYTKLSNKLQNTNSKSIISQTITKQKNILQDQVKNLEEHRTKLRENLSKITEILAMNQKNQPITNDDFQFEKIKSIDSISIFHKIKTIFVIEISLKTQEHVFREQCQKDALHFNQTISNVNTYIPEEQSCVTDYDTIKKSIDKTKLVLAKKNRTLASISRQLDDVPGRSELTQYQRRFMELYNQVSATHKETKQYYTLYNTLYDTKLYLSKEFSLLNSIQDNYKEAMASISGKEEFLKQFETISLGVKRNKKKLEEKYADEKDKTYILNKQLAVMTEQQRKYVTAVKQLTIECRKNEALLARLRTN